MTLTNVFIFTVTEDMTLTNVFAMPFTSAPFIDQAYTDNMTDDCFMLLLSNPCPRLKMISIFLSMQKGKFIKDDASKWGKLYMITFQSL